MFRGIFWHHWWLRAPKSVSFWAAALLLPLLVLWALTIVLYVLNPIYQDHVEAAVITITQQWLHGRPLYHSLGAPYLYSLLYGPACFFSIGLWSKLIPD